MQRTAQPETDAELDSSLSHSSSIPFPSALLPTASIRCPFLILCCPVQVLYIPLWICIVLNIVLYARVRWSIQKALKSQAATAENAASRARIEAVIARLQLYPLVLIGVWFWASINRIFEAATGRQLFWLTMLHRVFSTSQASPSHCRAALLRDSAVRCRCASLDDHSAVFSSENVPHCCSTIICCRALPTPSYMASAQACERLCWSGLDLTCQAAAACGWPAPAAVRGAPLRSRAAAANATATARAALQESRCMQAI